MGFEAAYRQWLGSHLARRRGERRRRLKEGHGYGEKLLLEQVWWPVLGNFDDLHPEYEIVDKHGSYYYLDFAYVRYPKPTDLEADGFGPHARDADRRDFSKDRRRQNSIALSGWNCLRFSIDDIKDDPAYCRSTLIDMLEEWYGKDSESWLLLPLRKRELVRLATRSLQPIHVSDAAACLGIGDRLSRDLLHELIEEGYLESASGTKRVHTYKLAKRK